MVFHIGGGGNPNRQRKLPIAMNALVATRLIRIPLGHQVKMFELVTTSPSASTLSELAGRKILFAPFEILSATNENDVQICSWGPYTEKRLSYVFPIKIPNRFTAKFFCAVFIEIAKYLPVYPG